MKRGPGKFFDGRILGRENFPGKIFLTKGPGEERDGEGNFFKGGSWEGSDPGTGEISGKNYRTQLRPRFWLFPGRGT